MMVPAFQVKLLEDGKFGGNINIQVYHQSSILETIILP